MVNNVLINLSTFRTFSSLFNSFFCVSCRRGGAPRRWALRACSASVLRRRRRRRTPLRRRCWGRRGRRCSTSRCGARSGCSASTAAGAASSRHRTATTSRSPGESVKLLTLFHFPLLWSVWFTLILLYVQDVHGTLQQTFVDFIWIVPLPAGYVLGRWKPGRIGIADCVKWRKSEIKVNKSWLQGAMVTL